MQCEYQNPPLLSLFLEDTSRKDIRVDIASEFPMRPIVDDYLVIYIHLAWLH